MKIYVITDLEGISGVVNFEQAGRDGKGAEYERARRLLTNEVNTVVSACREAGAKYVLVNDGHSSGYNFIVEDLHPDGEYVVGSNRNRSLLSEDFDGVILLGYHAMAGTENAVLDHTQCSRSWYKYWINDILMGEIGQCAVLAGAFGVPIILVTGDTAACKEAQALLPKVETVSVKEGLSRTSAKIIPPSKTQELIREGVKKALRNIGNPIPYSIKYPAKIRIEFQTTEHAGGYERGGWTRINGTTVEKIIQKPKHASDLKIY